MTDRKLKQVPLVEYLFEVRWGAAEGGALHDEFELALGVLHQKLRKDYPALQRLNSLPRQLYDAFPPVRNVPFVRFLKGQPETSLSYPLVQYGPGMATCNVDGASYEWARFADSAVGLFDNLVDCHLDLQNRIDLFILRSIDVFEVAETDLAAFVENNTTIDIKCGADELPSLAAGTKLPGFSAMWRLAGESTVRITAAPGAAGGKQGLVIDIVVESRQGALQGHGDVRALLAHQHQLAGDSFFKLMKKEFEDVLRNG